jgi:hypothetical protein
MSKSISLKTSHSRRVSPQYMQYAASRFYALSTDSENGAAWSLGSRSVTHRLLRPLQGRLGAVLFFLSGYGPWSGNVGTYSCSASLEGIASGGLSSFCSASENRRWRHFCLSHETRTKSRESRTIPSLSKPTLQVIWRKHTSYASGFVQIRDTT